MMQAALAPFRWAIGVVRRWDSLTTCALCRRILPADSCRVTCTCASVKVKKRVGVCAGVTYCPECFESLRSTLLIRAAADLSAGESPEA